MADSKEWVTMTHPDLADAPTARATREAFDEVWAVKGWTEVDPATVRASELLGRPVNDLNGLKKEELVSLSSRLGTGTGSEATKADLVTAVESALRGGEEAPTNG